SPVASSEANETIAEIEPRPGRNTMIRQHWIRSVVVGLITGVLLAPVAGETAGKKPLPRPAGSIIITGELEDRVFLTFEELSALPLTLHELSVTFKAGSATETHVFTGFLLLDVLNLLHPQFDPDVKNDKLRFYVSATGTDDYQAIVAWGELDPDFEG